MPVPNDADQYDSYFQTGERSIPVVLTNRIKKSTTTETRIPGRKTIGRSNRNIKAKSVQTVSLYNKLSLAKISSEKLSSKIGLRFVLLRKAYPLELAQRNSAFKFNHYSDLFYLENI